LIAWVGHLHVLWCKTDANVMLGTAMPASADAGLNADSRD